MLDFIESGSEDELDEEVYPRDTPLFEINWRRIVLDEAHTCRNPTTQLYRAICGLKGERRWAVTGTPIVNSTKDLGALAAWCGLQPFASDPKE
jgi:SNF2 family DNA or RNA helicase